MKYQHQSITRNDKFCVLTLSTEFCVMNQTERREHDRKGISGDGMGD